GGRHAPCRGAGVRPLAGGGGGGDQLCAGGCAALIRSAGGRQSQPPAVSRQPVASAVAVAFDSAVAPPSRWSEPSIAAAMGASTPPPALRCSARYNGRGRATAKTNANATATAGATAEAGAGGSPPGRRLSAAARSPGSPL